MVERRNAGRGSQVLPCPGDRAASRIQVVSLAAGTAAQLVTLPLEYADAYRVQVAEAIPLGLRAAVARHLIEFHLSECCTRSCAQARCWLPVQQPVSA